MQPRTEQWAPPGWHLRTGLCQFWGFPPPTPHSNALWALTRTFSQQRTVRRDTRGHHEELGGHVCGNCLLLHVFSTSRPLSGPWGPKWMPATRDSMMVPKESLPQPPPPHSKKETALHSTHDYQCRNVDPSLAKLVQLFKTSDISRLFEIKIPRFCSLATKKETPFDPNKHICRADLMGLACGSQPATSDSVSVLAP